MYLINNQSFTIDISHDLEDNLTIFIWGLIISQITHLNRLLSHWCNRWNFPPIISMLNFTHKNCTHLHPFFAHKMSKLKYFWSVKWIPVCTQSRIAICYRHPNYCTLPMTEVEKVVHGNSHPPLLIVNVLTAVLTLLHEPKWLLKELRFWMFHWS